MVSHVLALRIGLTGGIGSGKSVVAGVLAQHGADIVDTDLIARELTLPGGTAIEAIRQEFGPGYIDASGALDRKHMRELVFSDPGARRRLEAVLHPRIGIEVERQAAVSSAPVIVFDVPLLVESGARWRRKVHKVLVVDCLEETQIKRVMARSGWPRPTVEAVLAQQATRAARRACADAVLFNDAIPAVELALEVGSLWRRWNRARP
ncbi:MAG: dephospho-CoA kinase [Burkholderiaceae bacterium]